MPDHLNLLRVLDPSTSTCIVCVCACARAWCVRACVRAVSDEQTNDRYRYRYSTPKGSWPFLLLSLSLYLHLCLHVLRPSTDSERGLPPVPVPQRSTERGYRLGYGYGMQPGSRHRTLRPRHDGLWFPRGWGALVQVPGCRLTVWVPLLRKKKRRCHKDDIVGPGPGART